MGRPIEFDRERALDAFMHEIWRSGFEAFSVQAASQQLGITRSSFYNTFGSKEALFLEALQRYFVQNPLAKLESHPEAASVLRLLSQVFRDVCRARTSDPEHRGCMAVNCFSELSGKHAQLGPLMDASLRSGILTLDQLLQTAVKTGELAADTDTNRLALALHATLLGMNVMSKTVKEKPLWDSTRLALQSLGVYRR